MFLFQSLLVLQYLIKNGSERVVTSAREHIYDLRSLENYTYVDDVGKDQGVNIRHKVKDLIDFVQDDDRLREERKKAKKNKDKFIGMSSDMLGGRFGGKFKFFQKMMFSDIFFMNLYCETLFLSIVIFFISVYLLSLY